MRKAPALSELADAGVPPFPEGRTVRRTLRSASPVLALTTVPVIAPGGWVGWAGVWACPCPPCCGVCPPPWPCAKITRAAARDAANRTAAVLECTLIQLTDVVCSGRVINDYT